MATAAQAALRIERLSKNFTPKRRALDDVSLTVMPGEIVALIGVSGSGKSTLLRHVAGLVAGNREAGTVCVCGETVQQSGRIAADIRRVRGGIGVVFQQFNLVGRLSVLTNVCVGGLSRVPLWRSLLRMFTRAEKNEALKALSRVGIVEQAFQRASTLSGGQQQRAAIARALVQKAKVILADEPIASLDPESARRVMQILATINREDGITVVVSLHQVGFALRYCRRVVALDQGRIVYDGPAAALDMQQLRDIYGSESEIDFRDTEPAVDAPPDARPLFGSSLANAAAG
jgi:phosphonate transport system ATP-binding protein